MIKPKEARAKDIEWYDSAPGVPNDKEMFAAAVLVVKTRESLPVL